MNDQESWNIVNRDFEFYFPTLFSTVIRRILLKLRDICAVIWKFLTDAYDSALPYDSAEETLKHIEYVAVNIVFKFVISWAIIKYMIFPDKPTLTIRISFALTCIYFIIRSWNVNRTAGNCKLCIGYVEFLAYAVIYTAIHTSDTWYCIVGNLCVMGAISMIASDIRIIFAFSTLFSMMNWYVLYISDTPKFMFIWTHLTFIYYFFCFLSRIRIAQCSAYSDILESMQKTSLNNINTTMFVASVTHELKNPLNSILGCIEQLKESTNTTFSEKQNLVTAGYSVQILLYLIGNIHDISKISCGKFDIDRFPISILHEVSKVCRIERELATMKNLKFYKKISTPMPNLIYGDPMRLEQILINLLGNAIKFTHSGYIGIILHWVAQINEMSEESEFIPPEDYFGHDKSFKEEYAKKLKNAAVPAVSSFDISNDSDLLNGTSEQIEEGVVSDQINKYSKFKPIPGCIEKHTEECKTDKKQESPRLKNRASKLENLHSASLSRFSDLHMEADRPGDFSDSELSEIECVQKVRDSAGILVIDIVDTGIGISKEGQKKLFQPFSQAHKCIRKQFESTGLGLWITKQLLDLMNGVIEVKSEENHGTRFRIRIPFTVCLTESGSRLELARSPIMLSQRLSLAADELRKIGKIRCKTKSNTLKGMNILVIEDNTYLNNGKLEQLAKLLYQDNCVIYYCSYDTVIDYLSKETYKIDVIFVIASGLSKTTKNVISKIIQYRREKRAEESSQIPICVASGIFNKFTKIQKDIASQGEYTNMCDSVITFPLEKEALYKLLLSAKSKDEKHVIANENYRNLVRELSMEFTFGTSNKLVQTKKIILADDDAACQLMVKSMIEQAGGYEVIAFFNGMDVIKCYEQRGELIRLIIMDLSMPGLNGMETAKKVREMEKRMNKKKVPILCLTGHDDEELVKECKIHGIDEVVFKPIKKKNLMELLNAYIK